MQKDGKAQGLIGADRPTPRMIAVDKMTVYREVQRMPPTKKLVTAIADHFEPCALGAIHVSQRSDGSLSVMDGQRRLAALKHLGMHSYRCNCLVYTGLSVAQEAAMFRLLNNTRQVGAADSFDKGIVAGDEKCLGIVRLLEKRDLRVARTAMPGAACCVSALTKAWDHDGVGNLLEMVIAVLDESFGRDHNTFVASLVAGMAKFLSRDGVNRTVLIEKLRAQFRSPLQVVMAARSRMESERGSLAHNVATVIERTYESRRRATR